MKDILLIVVKLGLPFSVMASMFAQGLGIAPNQLCLFKERPRMMARSLAVVLVLVPAAVLLVILALKPSRPVAIGLAILAASPAAPMMLVRVPGQGGSLAYMACLHLGLALLALVTVPVTLDLLAKALGFQASVGVYAVAKVVGMTILLPVSLGVATRVFFPEAAVRIGSRVARVSGTALLALVIVLVGMTFRRMMTLDPWSVFVMAVVVAVSIAIGHGLGPRDPEERTTLAMESASRHPGLALTIAALNFNAENALAVLVPYLVVFLVVSTVYLNCRRRSRKTGPE